MAVVCRSSAGWLLDELSLINTWYQTGRGQGAASASLTSQQQDSPGTLYRLKDDLFTVLTPYFSMQPSPAATEPSTQRNVCQGSSATAQCKPVRKKRKRSNVFNQGELDALEYHKKISDVIVEGSQLLIQDGIKKGLLQPVSRTGEEKGTIVTVKCYHKSNLSELCDMTKLMPCMTVSEYTVNVLGTGSPVGFSLDTDYLSRITENNTDWPQLIHLAGEKYLLPPKSSFLLSDISNMEPLLHYKKYNVIVIDPPWENKSVKRSKRYTYLTPLEIKQLPISALASPNCLVVTWVTNRQKHLRFVKEELYPHWSVRPLAEWHWVKITQSGEFVFPINSAHKKPYEILVLGRLVNADTAVAREAERDIPPIPQHKIIVSVPCKLHSHKPPLTEVLKEYVSPDVEHLELFARNLQPGWTSWGNEVLKFQHIDYFIPLETGN